MPKKERIEGLHPHYKQACKELILAYKRLGTVQKYFKEGKIEDARELIGHVKHYVKDGLSLLDVKDKDLKNEEEPQ